ncbi:hypothetical protein T439DRAFT_357027 [Meredithblackwellia eburnea MCA 4105]
MSAFVTAFANGDDGNPGTPTSVHSTSKMVAQNPSTVSVPGPTPTLGSESTWFIGSQMDKYITYCKASDFDFTVPSNVAGTNQYSFDVRTQDGTIYGTGLNETVKPTEKHAEGTISFKPDKVTYKTGKPYHISLLNAGKVAYRTMDFWIEDSKC